MYASKRGSAADENIDNTLPIKNAGCALYANAKTLFAETIVFSISALEFLVGLSFFINGNYHIIIGENRLLLQQILCYCDNANSPLSEFFPIFEFLLLIEFCP